MKLADGKERTIQHMMCTSFWHPDGTPMSAQQFMEELFGKLPDFFMDEDELRRLWSDPETRKRLLRGLAEKGFGPYQLAEMQRIISAERSDLFDVLAFVAYAMPPVTRQHRAERARVYIEREFNAEATGIPGVRARALCWRRRGGIGPGETESAAEVEVPRFDSRCVGRSG